MRILHTTPPRKDLSSDLTRRHYYTSTRLAVRGGGGGVSFGLVDLRLHTDINTSLPTQPAELKGNSQSPGINRTDIHDDITVEIHNRMVSRWVETRSGYRVGEIFNMFDILPIHRNKLGNYNRPKLKYSYISDFFFQFIAFISLFLQKQFNCFRCL